MLTAILTLALQFFTNNFFLCLLELSNTGEPISRKKSLKKSIRDSFRRLRRSRKGTRKRDDKDKDKEGAEAASPGEQSPPVQRLVHENRVDETVLSMVRCIYFVDTFLKDGKCTSDILIQTNMLTTTVITCKENCLVSNLKNNIHETN